MKTIHTPNGPVHACQEHAQQIIGFFSFMGCHVGVADAPEGAACSNCENEKKAKE